MGAALYFQADGKPVVFPVSIFSIALFVLQVLVVWLAFLLLPFSEEKGRHRSVQSDEDLVGECCGVRRYKGRGGRLAQLFIYDLFCFIVLSAVAIAAFAGRPEETISVLGDLSLLGVAPEDIAGIGVSEPDRRLTEVLYWARTVYGLVALPFMIFLMPVAGDLLTHTLPTAYDRWGRTTAAMDAKQLSLRSRERRMRLEMAASERQLNNESWLCQPYYKLRGLARRHNSAAVAHDQPAGTAASAAAGAPARV